MFATINLFLSFKIERSSCLTIFFYTISGHINNILLCIDDDEGNCCTIINTIIKELELGNVKTFNDRIENLEFNADIIICRSVSSIKNILKWSKKSLKENGKIILLKGGDVDKELININKRFGIYSDDYFQNKKIIEIQS